MTCHEPAVETTARERNVMRGTALGSNASAGSRTAAGPCTGRLMKAIYFETRGLTPVNLFLLMFLRLQWREELKMALLDHTLSPSKKGVEPFNFIAPPTVLLSNFHVLGRAKHRMSR